MELSVTSLVKPERIRSATAQGVEREVDQQRDQQEEIHRMAAPQASQPDSLTTDLPSSHRFLVPSLEPVLTVTLRNSKGLKSLSYSLKRSFPGPRRMSFPLPKVPPYQALRY